MNLEKININSYENKKSPEFREWIDSQIMSPSEEWDTGFRKYVDQKYAESQERESKEGSLEKTRQDTWKRYLEGLNLKEEHLKDKRILDLGCDTGDFVISCLEKDITEDAYGSDMELKGEALDEKYQKNFFQGNFKEELPVKNLDYIVSVGAISLFINKEATKSIEETIKNSYAALKEGGEIKICPIPKVSKHSDLEGAKESREVILKILEELKKELSIEWNFTPIDIKVSGKNKDVWLEEVLTIKKG
ncbi:MAG: hypothetical protein GF387_00170 [Candidatus Portnoybacteria bacterium]|nr:hypothetical protein [Candidatus Portnoybacteria bacterium]